MLDARRVQMLKTMGISRWRLRGQPVEQCAKEIEQIDAESVEQLTDTPLNDENSWRRLEFDVRQCTACDLHETRKQTVFGVGNRQAACMIIGEAPGAEEDALGEPFVGRAGKLLNEMLFAIGLKREQVFIANILKCRPPNNRDPRPEEVVHCEKFLHRQIALIRPQLILSVGGHSAKNLLKTQDTVGRLRGRVHRYGEDAIPLVVTYHPAYLLRSPLEKRKAWADLLLAKNVMG